MITTESVLHAATRESRFAVSVPSYIERSHLLADGWSFIYPIFAGIPMTRVLLLSAGFGDGHRQVANALRESFIQRDVTVFEVDCFENTNLFLAKVNQWLYEVTTRYFPALYGFIYRKTANLSPNHVLWKWLSLFSRKAFVRALKLYQPDIVLQLFPDHGVEFVPRQHVKPFIGAVITDFSVHSHWFHPNVDAYFIPHSAMKSDMEAFVSSGAKIIDSGIPIRNQFVMNHNAPTHPDTPYILFATGGRGLFPDLENVIQTILTKLPTVDVYVMCGRNTAMLRRIETLIPGCRRLRALPYVDNVAELFRGASLAVVKAGGVTVSECLVSQCPMIFYRPQPGQEADNADFLERMGAGKVVRNERDLIDILTNRTFWSEIARMKEVCASLAHPDASDVIAEYVLGQVHQHATQSPQYSQVK
jgi:processive 1,2-diacylglycerol beta-glucosyltransferase